MNKYKILAVIPARKNSKRVPNKNMRLINRKPLIFYTISEALKSKKNNRYYSNNRLRKHYNI